VHSKRGRPQTAGHLERSKNVKQASRRLARGLIRTTRPSQSISMKKQQTTYEVWGRQCGKGWDALVQPLEEKVLRLGGRIRQVKEKFGRLCFFYSLPRSVTAPRRLAFARTVQRAEEMSLRICEACGRPGQLFNDGGFYLTRCEACFLSRPVDG
jgi:hypothetical protein